MRHAVVTGASRGIGLEFARQLHGAGWRVSAGCRQPDRATQLRDAFATDSHRGRLIALDVADPASVGSAAATLTAPVDLLINVAGIGAPPGCDAATAEGPLPALQPQALLDVYRVNAVGPAIVTQAIAPHLSRTGAVVVNISSDLGSLHHATVPGSYGYAMSKAALNMLTRKLALELQHLGATVVSLHPGSVRTDMGGPTATHPVHDAVRAMLTVIAQLGPAETGSFLTYQGDPLPW